MVFLLTVEASYVYFFYFCVTQFHDLKIMKKAAEDLCQISTIFKHPKLIISNL